MLFKSAYVVDVARITAHAHRMGALVSLDAYHSVGVVPVDVQAIGADFLTGGVLKWLCGGPGGCFLYASPEASARYAPALTGWQAHAHPFAFDGEMEYASGAARWLGGTPVIPALFANMEGPRIVRRAGMDAIRAKSMRQTARLIELADAHGYHGERAARSGAAWRHCRVRRSARRRGRAGAARARCDHRLSARRGHSRRAAFLYDGRRSRARRR